jgi:hypothetical protein
VPNPALPNGIIAGLWDVLFPPPGEFFSQTLGTAPNRQFVVEFKGVQNFETGLDDTWEIILHEGTNEIVVHYQAAHGSVGFGSTAGIENTAGTIGLRWAGGGPGSVTLVNQAVRYMPASGLINDQDGDGRSDCIDNCPAHPNPGQEDTDGNGVGDACNDAEDADGDEFADALDNCPADPNPGQEDTDSNGVGDACNDSQDGDGDEWADLLDNCPMDANPTQQDLDGDGFGDACDACIGFGVADGDGDSVCDSTDNCPSVPNPNQENCDFDSLGDACDPDATDPDADGIADPCDNCPGVANPSQTDCDFDGLGDACDPDAVDLDGDGVAGSCDNCPAASNPDQLDRTADGVGDACDQGALDTTTRSGRRTVRSRRSPSSTSASPAR